MQLVVMGGTNSKLKRGSFFLSKYVRPTYRGFNRDVVGQEKKTNLEMNTTELEARCEAFREALHCARHADRPLENDFVRRFNRFVAEHPRVVLEWKDEYGETLLTALYWYLNRAIERKYGLETYQDLVIRTPQVLAEEDKKSGWTLLHSACWFGCRLGIVSFLAQQNPDAAEGMDWKKQTPLHIACRLKAPLQVIRVLVDAYPRAIPIRDDDGNTPLHLTCYCGGAPLDVIQYLVAQQPHLCLRQNKEGVLPVELARLGDRGDDDIVEFMTTATTAAARVLMKRFLCFDDSPAPRELFGQVAAYLRGGGTAVEMSAVVVALSVGEIMVSFRRGDVQEEFREHI